VLVSAAAGFFLLPRAIAHKLDKSIAVLPFENLSDDKENAYFADGIQDDVLTNLAKIGDLKVISRTSVMGYRGKPGSVKEIAKALGVSAVLEGTVRKDKTGNRVRVNVQLINAETDEHVWAQEYDRDLTDMFGIQTEIAQKIAEELQAKLSPTERVQLTRKPTENGEAYLAFVQARNLYRHEDLPALKQAEQLFERALQLDPKFALAAAWYSQVESWIYHSFDPDPERSEKARELAETALRLQPDLPEAHLARGFAYYYGEDDYDSAAREFAEAQRGLPNFADAYLAIGAIQRRQGLWAESTANLKKSVDLSPGVSWPLQNLFFNYSMTRDYEAAGKILEQALAIDPNSLTLRGQRVKLAIDSRGDITALQQLAEEKAPAQVDAKAANLFTSARVYALIFQRKWAEALAAAETLPEDMHTELPAGFSGKEGLIGTLKLKLGDKQGARDALLKARATLEAQIAKAPTTPAPYCQYAFVLAFLGEKEPAMTAVKRGMTLDSEGKDAFGGPDVTEAAAQVYGILGEKDRAFSLLDHLLSVPSSVTVFNIKLNPLWDSLRDDPRFQALIDKYSKKA
jgi:serine/threonine-protein kinase